VSATIGDGPIYDPIPETCEEALARWDRGEPVFTAEMGGLGPGYEQCIQIMAFEAIRGVIGKELPAEKEPLNKLFDDAMKESVARLHPSGAQFGAAKNLAYCVLSRGYRKALLELPEDRLIQVSRELPR
jgi:hypothetical protein